ncbi:MAG: 30S ribosome-binding factor RbfA [Bacteroidetes bacterium]|nr:30S ribosome-binding factor RbfA [Bacteroidota bacterium]MBU1680776.1 30S ribosome-binding factor RbfA [Bacteroidota bacterium]MBU2505689.1 30S ribosome-binding factor RbfA [Bacteroidota bacterium]
MSIRLKKISALIKEELSLIFLHKIQDPKIGMVTITGVKVTPDLKIAKIYVSIYRKEEREEALQRLEELKGFIKAKLASKVRHLRQIPDLNFYLDDTLDYVMKMENIFKEIQKNDKQDLNDENEL